MDDIGNLSGGSLVGALWILRELIPWLVKRRNGDHKHPHSPVEVLDQAIQRNARLVLEPFIMEIRDHMRAMRDNQHRLNSSVQEVVIELVKLNTGGTHDR